MRNTLNWFELPVTDMARATSFYSQLFGVELSLVSAGSGSAMAMFPDGGGVGGALIVGEGYVPSASGAVVYLNCNPSLDTVLERVTAAGGQIIMPKTDIGENGYYAFILDTEGNRVGLHESARQ
jgi:predicted enzyme related to lactoylglutathione lyase